MVPVSGISESENSRVIDGSSCISMRWIPHRLEYDRLAGLSRECVSTHSRQIASKYSQTPLLRTPLAPEKVSVLQSVLIKRVYFKENIWGRTKKIVR